MIHYFLNTPKLRRIYALVHEGKYTNALEGYRAAFDSLNKDLVSINQGLVHIEASERELTLINIKYQLAVLQYSIAAVTAKLIVNILSEANGKVCIESAYNAIVKAKQILDNLKTTHEQGLSELKKFNERYGSLDEKIARAEIIILKSKICLLTTDSSPSLLGKRKRDVLEERSSSEMCFTTDDSAPRAKRQCVCSTVVTDSLWSAVPNLVVDDKNQAENLDPATPPLP